MAGRISARDIEEVKARTNIADVISEYVALKSASAGSLKGLCPFHQEKSPSFNVRPSQGFYHCFGCGVGGDVYKFIQEIESLGFSEAVEFLAAKVGYQLTYEAGGAAPDYGLRARILEANSAAAAYYQGQLISEEAGTGREFLKQRGFDREAAEQFGIGYAPKGWNNLTDKLKLAGFSEEELITASLASKGDKGIYDKFRGRLIWPIRDSSNQVIGFGARKLYEDDQGPKYLNTAETPVYHKSAVLYGIDLAKKDISKTQQVVIVEGYTDVMACHLAGVTVAVATCGTAFGDDHIRFLNRMLSSSLDKPAEVIFTFDPDEAGQKAAMRAFSDSEKFNANSFIAVGPDGLDPCDLRTQKGDEALRLMIQQRRPIFEFAIKQKLKNFDLGSIEGRVGAAKAAAPVVATIRDSTLRPVYIRELANWVNLDVSEVNALVDRAIKEKVTQSVEPLRVEPAIRTELPPIDLKDPNTRLEKTILEVLIQAPELVGELNFQELLSGDFTTPAFSQISTKLRELGFPNSATNWLGELMNSLEPALQPVLRALAASELPATSDEELARYVAGVVRSGHISSLSRQKLSLQAVLRQLDQSETEKISQIQLELVAIENRRRELQGG